MIGTGRYVVTDNATAEDVDLDAEVVRLKDGRRLTNELAEQLVEETLAEAHRRNLVPGRKSLSGGSRLDQEHRAQLTTPRSRVRKGILDR